MNKMRIVFMGTPEFAVPTLRALVEGGYNVVAVVTTPDRKAGRGQKVVMCPVKEYAVEANLPVLQPEKLKAPEFVEELASYKADLQIVVAFRMLPEIVWDMPEKGTFNLHASLLPNYRGAAPINWAVINGEKKTGCTTFFLKHAIDTGDIIDSFEEEILPEDNVGTLYERLMNKGAGLVTSSVDRIQAGGLALKPQTLTGKENEAPKIFKETCEINWGDSTKKINDFIRGLSPYPAAWTTLNEKVLKIYKADIIDQVTLKEPFESDGKKFLYFKTGDGVLSIKELQLQGKKRMGVEEFLRGYKF